MKKSVFAGIFLCFFVLLLPQRRLYAQSLNPDSNFDDSSWRILEQAYDVFDLKDFGTAFRLAETAKERWKTEKEHDIGVLEHALSQPALLKAGDDLETVLNLLKERNNTDAVRIIESRLVRFGFESFDYSVKKFAAYVKNTAYPEADFLLGKLYMLEGEYALAETFFSSAYEQRKYLNVSDVQFDILNDLADLYALTGDNEKYEAVLLIFASQDNKYKQNGMSTAFIRSVVSAVQKGMEADKIFLLYRNDNYKSLYVWYRLAKYYYSLDLNEKAFETALLFCITALSRVDSIIKTRDMDYAYTELTALLHRIQTYSDIDEWAAKNELWESFYLLGVIAQKCGHSTFAQQIFTSVADQSPQRTWKILAQKELTDQARR